MKVTQTDKIRAVYEQIFWKAIDSYNESEMLTNPSAPDIITTSEARSLHNKAEDLVKGEQAQAGRLTHGFSTAGITSACGAIRRIMQERTGEDIFPETNRNHGMQGKDYYVNTPLYAKSMQTVLSVMDLEADKETIGPNGAYLVSPYDSRFAGRSAVLSNGSRMGAIQGIHAESLADAMDAVKGREIPFSRVYEDKDGNYKTRETDVMILSDDDISGIVRLRPYMTEREYEQVRDWANRGMNIGDMSPEAIERRRKALDRTVRILEGLRAEGRTYQIKRDARPGQIKACIDGTRLEVRVTEREGMESYIGHVYDRNDGANYRFDTTARKDPYDAKKGPAVYEPTPDDAFQLVRYAMGATVMRKDGKGPVGQATKEIIIPLNGGGRNGAEVNSTYVIDNKVSTIYGPYGSAGYNGISSVVMIRRTAGNANTTAMPSQAVADEYLRAAIQSARDNYRAELGVDALLSDWNENHETEGWEPTYSGDPAIATVQASYIDVLEGRRSSLLRPGVDEDEFLGELEIIGEYETDSVVHAGVSMSKLHSKLYTLKDGMTPEELVRKHAEESLEANIGTYDKGPDGTRFNPVGVAQFQSSGYSAFRNTDDIVQAMRILDMTREDVRGNTFYCNSVRDRLVKFDFTTSVPMQDKHTPFMQSMYETVRNSLEQNGVAFDSVGDGIRIDNNGIVHWTGSIAKTQGTKGARARVSGDIGQIFEPDARGVVKTAFNGSDNYAFVPGYEATITPQKPGEHLSVNERTRLKGYEQSMREAIAYQIRRDVSNFAAASARGATLGVPTSVNNTYRHLYDERYDIDFEETYARNGMDPTLVDAILKTQATRVKFPSAIREGATIYMQYQMENGALDIANDNNTNAAALVGGRNMGIMDEELDGGYYDLIATPSTTTNQGTVRQLCEGTTVTPDGRIIRAEDRHAQCPLLAHPNMQYGEFDKYDRRYMSFSNMMQAETVRPANIAMLTLNGWNEEDGMVVSKRWAGSNPGKPLVTGDKLEGHGNKGVIPLIVDTDLTEEEAKEQGIYGPWKLFKANPDLDIAMSPHSAIGRHNGGTFREGNANGAMSLNMPGGEVVEGAMIRVNMTVTDKRAEVKTHAYDSNDIAEGRGRKASAQLAWALKAKGATKMMSAFYGSNMAPLSNLREYLIACGMDLSDEGVIRRGYEPHEGEIRKVFKQPDLVYSDTKNGPKLSEREMRKIFEGLFERQGGVMEIPFELKYPNGDIMPPMNDGRTDVVYKVEEWERKGYTRKDGTYVRPTTVRRHTDANTSRANGQPLSWGMPVLSSYLRSGQFFEDGTSATHDFTHRYENIFINACKYRDMQGRLGSMTETERAEAEKLMQQMQNAAQSEYNAITGEIMQRQFEGKHNIFRDGVMSHRLANSATAVWTADPRLRIDQVAVGQALAETLGVKDGDQLQIWRDPILRDSGTRAMTVKIDDRLTGCAVAPVLGKPMDGDFDGDTVANVNLPEKARGEAFRLFSVQNNLLDYGEADENGKMPFSLFTAGGIQVARHMNPELDKEFNDLLDDLNKAYAPDAEIPWDKLSNKVKRGYMERLDALYQKAYEVDAVPSQVIRFDSAESHLESMAKACITTGAKGNWGKLRDYARQAGIIIEDAGKGPIEDFSKCKLSEHTLATFEEQQSVMGATLVKSFGTGLGGGYSQRGICGLGDIAPQAVLEATKPATQGILDSKHDEKDAKVRYELCHGPLRQAWRGAMMNRSENGKWEVMRNQDGSIMQSDPKTWVDNMYSLYTASTSANGLSVSTNRKWLEHLASKLTGPDGRIMNIESPEYLATHASPLDRLAYGGNFQTICEMANANDGKGTFLFEGENSQMFMPNAIRANRKNTQYMAEHEDAEVRPRKAIVKSDTLENGKQSGVSVRKTIDIDAILTNAQHGMDYGDIGE